MRSLASRVRKTLGVVVVVGLLVAVLAPATAVAQDEPPQPPMRLEGFVFISGVRAEDGTLVRVFIEGELAGSARTTTVEGKAGFYTVDIQSLEPVDVSVSVDGQPASFLVDGEPEETIPFDMGTQPYDVVIGDTPVTYTLTMVVVGEGITAPGVGEHQYSEGTQVRLAALPVSGWQFDGWAGDVADPDASTTQVTLDGDKTVTAQFSPGPTPEASEVPTDTPIPPPTETPAPGASPMVTVGADATATAEATVGVTAPPATAESAATPGAEEATAPPATAVPSPTTAPGMGGAEATPTPAGETPSGGTPSGAGEPTSAAPEGTGAASEGEAGSGPPWMVIGAIVLAAFGLGAIGFGLRGLRRSVVSDEGADDGPPETGTA